MHAARPPCPPAHSLDKRCSHHAGASYPDILEKISLPNLKAIQCMGAGVNFVLKRPDLNRPHRVFRVIEPSRCERMAFWNLWAVLNCQVGQAERQATYSCVASAATGGTCPCCAWHAHTSLPSNADPVQLQQHTACAHMS